MGLCGRVRNNGMRIEKMRIVIFKFVLKKFFTCVLRFVFFSVDLLVVFTVYLEVVCWLLKKFCKFKWLWGDVFFCWLGKFILEDYFVEKIFCYVWVIMYFGIDLLR